MKQETLYQQPSNLWYLMQMIFIDKVQLLNVVGRSIKYACMTLQLVLRITVSQYNSHLFLQKLFRIFQCYNGLPLHKHN